MPVRSEAEIATVLRICFGNIGLQFQGDQQMRQFAIKDLNNQLGQTSGTGWNAPVISFTNVIKIQFYRRGMEILDFEPNWFTDNANGTVNDQVVFIRDHMVEIW